MQSKIWLNLIIWLFYLFGFKRCDMMCMIQWYLLRMFCCFCFPLQLGIMEGSWYMASELVVWQSMLSALSDMAWSPSPNSSGGGNTPSSRTMSWGYLGWDANQWCIVYKKQVSIYLRVYFSLYHNYIYLYSLFAYLFIYFYLFTCIKNSKSTMSKWSYFKPTSPDNFVQGIPGIGAPVEALVVLWLRCSPCARLATTRPSTSWATDALRQLQE